MKRHVVLAVVLLSLAGCGLGERLGLGGGTKRSTAREGLPYKTRLSTGENRRDMTISVAAKGAGLGQVRESVRHAATKYCLLTYGGSDTDWAINPATGDWAYTVNGSDLIFRGRCTI